MSIPYLLLAIHSIKILFTTLHDNNKITSKNIIDFNNLGKILNTFQHRDDIRKTKKALILQSDSKFALAYSFTIYSWNIWIAKVLYLVKIYLVEENMEIQHVFMLQRILKPLCSKNSTQLLLSKTHLKDV